MLRLKQNESFGVVKRKVYTGPTGLAARGKSAFCRLCAVIGGGEAQ
jgi:hypothetical protein